MATEKEEVILSFQVEQADAITEMEKMKKLIVQTKAEQKELNDAYKKGNITLDEFVKEGVRLEANLKRQQSAYNNVQKSVTGVKTQLDKLIDSNQKISKDLQKTSQSFQDVAGQINIAGTNIGSLTTRLSSFSNPATAAIGIVSALGAAYARSTIGAKDLAFAQVQLAEATTLITNQFAGLISSSEDGEGLFTNLLNSVGFNTLNAFAGGPLALFGVNLEKIKNQSKELALIAEQLEDLQRSELELRTTANDRLADNQELLTQIQAEQTTYNQKLDLSNEIITNIRRSEEEVRTNLDEQLALVTKKLESDKANESLLDAQLAIKKEIAALEKDAEKRVQATVRLQQNLNEAESKRLGGLRGQGVTDSVGLSTDTKTGANFGKDTNSLVDQVSVNNEIVINGARYLNDALNKLDKDRTDNEKAQSELRLNVNKAVNEAYIDSAIMVFNAASGLARQGSEEQKILALTAIGIDTAEAIAHLTEKSEDNPLNSVTFGAAGVIQFAAGIARILANISAAKNYISGAAAGGGDFMTNGPSLLLVGDNPGGRERVTVEPISGKGETKIYGPGLMAMAGGGTLTSGGDPGGVITNSLTSEANQNLATQNAIKRMAKQEIVVSVKEITRVQNKIQVKERLRK